MNKQTNILILYILSSFFFVIIITLCFDYFGGTLFTDYMKELSLIEKGLKEVEIKKILDYSDKNSWLQYVLRIISLIFGILFMILCIKVGILLSNVTIPFAKILLIVIQAQLIWILPQMLQLGWFTFINPSYTLNDLQTFATLSIRDFLPYEGSFNEYFGSLFSLFSIYRLLYIAAVSYGISVDTGVEEQKGFLYFLKMTILCYGIPIFILNLLLSFLFLIKS